MMRLWLSKNSAASLREQLGTQLTLGVISGDLKPGSVIHAKLKGEAEGYPNKDGSKNVYKWDADLTATVRARP